MAWRLLVAALLVAGVYSALAAAGEGGLGFWIVGVAALLGYHRDVLADADATAWWTVHRLKPPSGRVRYRLWGFALGPARTARVRTRSGGARPGRAWLVELLPVPLQWLARRFG